MILGTAAYMAPEQARGKPVDKRADIWAFGVVLYEMLTGRRAFDGEDISDVLAAVLRQEIDWTQLPADTPPRLRRLLERCLERDPRTRLRDIGEARVEIAKIETGDTGGFAGGAPSVAIPADPWRDRLGRITSAVLAYRPGGRGLDGLDRSEPQFVVCRTPGASGIRSAGQLVVRRWLGGLDSCVPGRPFARVHRAIAGRPTPVVDGGA